MQHILKFNCINIGIAFSFTWIHLTDYSVFSFKNQNHFNDLDEESSIYYSTAGKSRI